MNKPILCVDFDGVIHSYSSGWKGADIIPDPPVPGALQFIVAAMEHFTVAIFSSRSCQPGGIAAMNQWLGYWSVDPVHGMPSNFDHGAWGAIQWPQEKPPAFLTIDDRAICFDGNWSLLEPANLLRFKPWNKRERAPEATAVDRILEAMKNAVEMVAGESQFTRAEIMSAALYLIMETGLLEPGDTRARLRAEVYTALENMLGELDAAALETAH